MGGHKMQKSKIEWCDCTLNPVVGCTYGCPFCYAYRINNRFHYVEDFSKPQFFPKRLDALKCKKPKVIFMDSMSDIADWEPEWLEAVYKAMLENPQHKYLFLTKRPEVANFMCGDNVWSGTSITKESEVSRFNYLPAWHNRFVSIEPILEDLQLREKHDLLFKFVSWVIVGAETGNRKDKVIPQREWIASIVNECHAANVPVFLKNSLAEIWGEPLIQEFPWGDSHAD
jgi:protein gp37